MSSILNSKLATGYLNGVQVVGGSNPLTPTKTCQDCRKASLTIDTHYCWG